MSKKTPSQDFSFEFTVILDKEKETRLQRIKRWIEKQTPPLNLILRHLFSYVEEWYWKRKVEQTMAEVDKQTDAIQKQWEKEDELNRQPIVEEEPSGVSDLPTLSIRNPVVERRTEESGTSVAPPSTQIQIPDPWE